MEFAINSFRRALRQCREIIQRHARFSRARDQSNTVEKDSPSLQIDGEGWSFDQLASFLPKYLSPQDQIQLFSEITGFISRRQDFNYYANVPDVDFLQGDGWAKIEYWVFESNEKRSIQVAIISNTCDIASENKRHLPPKIMVAPLIAAADFEQLLRENGISEQAIFSKMKDIKAQTISNIFFLPHGAGLDGDYLVYLDDIQAQPAETFSENAEKVRLFSLSQTAFWLFLMKLSVHFCRANEGVTRGFIPA